MKYQCKVAMVTGGGSGMGQLACRNMAQAGVKVAALDVNENGLNITAEHLDNISKYIVDITDHAAVQRVVEDIEKELGPIDRVFNCAAIMPFGKITEQPAAIQHKMMAINWGGLVNISTTVLPKMIERGNGDFVSFASMAGLIPTLLTGAYSATKAAVTFYNETLYHENINSGVRFASVHPPAVATPLLDQGKDAWPKMLDDSGDPIEPKEVLDAVEKALDNNVFFVYPNSTSKWGAIFRRLFPSAIWKQVHKVEGW